MGGRRGKFLEGRGSVELSWVEEGNGNSGFVYLLDEVLFPRGFSYGVRI